MQNIRAEVVLPTKQLRDDIPFFTKTLGMRMDEIFPADDPSVAVFSGYGLRVRVQKDAQTVPGLLRILCDDPMLIAGGQTRFDRAQWHAHRNCRPCPARSDAAGCA